MNFPSAVGGNGGINPEEVQPDVGEHGTGIRGGNVDAHFFGGNTCDGQQAFVADRLEEEIQQLLRW